MKTDPVATPNPFVTESLNNLIRVMNRLGRGYSFEALRSKIQFIEGIHKLSRPKFERRREPDPVMMDMMARSRNTYGWVGAAFPGTPAPTEIEKTGKNYGADINTRIRLLEESRL